MKKHLTVTYEIRDLETWGAVNPMSYAHNGMRAVTVAMGDAIERLRVAEDLITRCDFEACGISSELDQEIESFLHNAKAMASRP